MTCATVTYLCIRKQSKLREIKYKLEIRTRQQCRSSNYNANEPRKHQHKDEHHGELYHYL